MALGQPENELTVVVRYPNGRMRVHLHEVLTRTGKRCGFNRVLPNGDTEHGYGVDYPLSYCRKLLKLMAEWCTEEDLERIDKFIDEKDGKLYQEWMNQRTLVRR